MARASQRPEMAVTLTPYPWPVGLFRLLHPFPTLMNVVATLAFAVLATRGRLPWSTALGLGGTMLTLQAAIGITNDYVDRDLDRLAKPAKPLVRGPLTPRIALVLGIVASLLALAGGASFGWRSLLLVAAMLAIGLLYNVWLKRTPFSWLPYLAALPLEPLWVWTTLDRFTPTLLLLYPLGGALVVALHLANALADADTDRAAGVGGLVQTLGQRHAARLLWLSALLPTLLILVLGLVLAYRWVVLLPGLGLSLSFVLVGYVVTRRATPHAYRTLFGLLILSTLTLALAWLAATV